MTTAKQKTYARIARFYDFLDYPFEYGRYRALRRILWDGLSGKLLDAGVGTGRNIEFYPKGSLVTGIDLSPSMLNRAMKRDVQTGSAADVVVLNEGNVLKTSFDDDTFDAAVSSFLFCVLDGEHQLNALKELARITKPGGEVRILEYAYSKRPLKRFGMRLWAPWVRMMYGASFDRRTEQYAEAAGLVIKEERFVFDDIIKLLVLKA